MLDYQQSFIERILPLIGKCNFGTFDPDSLDYVALKDKFIKHIKDRNPEKLAMYVAFCYQVWENLEGCPLDVEEIIRPALDIIRA